MADTIDDGAPAFGTRTTIRKEIDWQRMPQGNGHYAGTPPTIEIVETTGGMSLRDWFAGQALAGMTGDEWDFRNAAGDPVSGNDRVEAFAITAYLIADMMLAKRKKVST